MNVLVDTSVWSRALRRRGTPSPSDEEAARELTELINEGRALLAGPIRQEILSGISEAGQFTLLRDRLRAFEDIPIRTADYERAAEFSNTCRRAGVQGSHMDFLICSTAAGNGASIFTMDRDFDNYAKHVPIVLHRPRALQRRNKGSAF
jgi:predicted nucleic acid-binding protein